MKKTLKNVESIPAAFHAPCGAQINIEKRKPFHFNKVLMGLGVLLDKLATRHGKAVEEERGDDL